MDITLHNKKKEFLWATSDPGGSPAHVNVQISPHDPALKCDGEFKQIIRFKGNVTAFDQRSKGVAEYSIRWGRRVI